MTALLEQMRDLAFQFCVVDPEGDYSEFPDAVVVGDAKQEPRISELKALLAKPEVSVVANLLAIDAAERRVRSAVPIARVIYLEPDLLRSNARPR